MFGNILKKWTKVVPWTEMCNHYYQNESCRDESQTENHWYSRP